MSLQTATRVARLRRARDICTDNELSWHDIHDDDGLRVEVTNYNDCPVHLVRATAEVDACVEDVFDWASDVNAWRTYSQNNTTIDYRVIEHHGNYRITHIIKKAPRGFQDRDFVLHEVGQEALPPSLSNQATQRRPSKTTADPNSTSRTQPITQPNPT